ncbi:interleukin-1 alpha [Nycticebus coucang]|uniref:interleukin-1 alpha n=1 Tax=Nycticebus coucang TaxID=9470 RepID=UPI00234DE300|nr:interleukin-1 alpha [Nycticebus coucang]XP_053445926.1 interleukin-1 alpha [Nycticebus coucang]
MARVPDLFEDYYSENEEYSSTFDQLCLNQKSFYDASHGSHHKDCVDQFMCLSASETSKGSGYTVKESVVVVTAKGKVLKKRRFSLNQPITDDDLEAISHDREEEIIQPTSVQPISVQPRSVPINFMSNVKYRFMRIIKHQFILNDALNQSVIQDNSHQYLTTAALNNLDDAVKFDMGAYKSAEDSKLPVTLRISNTRLYVSAQDEDQPVLLKEMPETPKIITDGETNLLFFWETFGTKNYFTSVAQPTLYLATKQDNLVHLAKGPPSTTDFQILET